jgi:hypothetical protein
MSQLPATVVNTVNYSAVVATHAPHETVDLEFNRVLQAILEGTNKFQGLTPEEVEVVSGVLAEKRAEYSSGRAATPHYPSRFSGRVQSILTSDPRVKTIFETRLQRRRVTPEGPIRYLGFVTTPTCRVFRFGRLPVRSEADVFQVRVAHGFFSPLQMSLQEGPGFCAGILADKDHPADYEVSADDIQGFMAKKPAKSTKRGYSAPAKTETE